MQNSNACIYVTLHNQMSSREESLCFFVIHQEASWLEIGFFYGLRSQIVWIGRRQYLCSLDESRDHYS
ncbi:hypothetical protein ISN44_As03g022970 [Arabidopsis suecica]|uniref:Uncharacterized protein n=1 Tax=Arabidopsis suecica TaxID=45249 RepID=A0A8T2F8D7_ARASU|nr:hypothetical protein ISN44_As03g022970 [Arabidopsis suecica]